MVKYNRNINITLKSVFSIFLFLHLNLNIACIIKIRTTLCKEKVLKHHPFPLSICLSTLPITLLNPLKTINTIEQNPGTSTLHCKRTIQKQNTVELLPVDIVDNRGRYRRELHVKFSLQFAIFIPMYIILATLAGAPSDAIATDTIYLCSV